MRYNEVYVGLSCFRTSRDLDRISVHGSIAQQQQNFGYGTQNPDFVTVVEL